MSKLLRRVTWALTLPLVVGAPVVLAAPAHAALPYDVFVSTTSDSPALYGQAVQATVSVVDSTTEQPATGGHVDISVTRPGHEGASFDDVPVDAAGHATSGNLVEADGHPLTPTGGISDTWTISVTYWPTDSEGSPDGTGSATLDVIKAPGSVAVVAGPSTVTADISGAAPSAALPTTERATGPVTFTIDGVAQAPVQAVAGKATLNRTLPPGPHTLSASYDGDTLYTAGASGTETRKDPVLEARVLSLFPRKAGWYSAPVEVWFRCQPQGSELVEECPEVATLKQSGRGQSVTARISAKDGGSTTVTVSGIDIDRQKPRIMVKGLSCTATDKLSGVRGRCKVTPLGGGRYQAIAQDRAGNVKVKAFRVG